MPRKNLALIFFIFFASCSLTKVKDVQQEPLSEVTKIEFLDDGKPIIYIKKDTLEGIIIEYSKMLETKKDVKIGVGKKYLISLTRIDRNYRGTTSEYIIASSKGTEKVIWSRKDSLPLILYRANNINGLYINEELYLNKR